MQEELDELVIFLVDLDEYIQKRSEEAEAKAEAEEAEAKAETYVVRAGTEKHVHLRIVRGNRFDPNTGERISNGYIQMFTYAEWQLFKKSFKGLGYTILAVLHDPYNDAASYVAKK